MYLGVADSLSKVHRPVDPTLAAVRGVTPPYCLKALRQ
jgi:hypothetical protein